MGRAPESDRKFVTVYPTHDDQAVRPGQTLDKPPLDWPPGRCRPDQPGTARAAVTHARAFRGQTHSCPLVSGSRHVTLSRALGPTPIARRGTPSQRPARDGSIHFRSVYGRGSSRNAPLPHQVACSCYDSFAVSECRHSPSDSRLKRMPCSNKRPRATTQASLGRDARQRLRPRGSDPDALPDDDRLPSGHGDGRPRRRSLSRAQRSGWYDPCRSWSHAQCVREAP